MLLIREIHGSGANEMTRSVNHTNNIPLVSDTNYNDLHNSQREVTQLQIIKGNLNTHTEMYCSQNIHIELKSLIMFKYIMNTTNY